MGQKEKDRGDHAGMTSMMLWRRDRIWGDQTLRTTTDRIECD